jgi:23S rRNA pseudouridine2605 synthase
MAHKRKRHIDRAGPSQEDGSDGRGERLQKVLASAGLGSRRDCEDLIREGRVQVDKQAVTELGTRVDPVRQEIRVDGEPLRRPKKLYYAVNKPIGVVTTSNDPSGRTRVIDLVPTDERVFAVGRLDRSSEGLILVTNDGEFANRITHPRYGVEKTYLVRVAGAPDQRQLARLKKGVHLAEGYARAQSIAVKKKHGQSTDLVIVLNEGRNREIRRILARVGHKVVALKRVAVGPVKLGDLEPGAWRRVTDREVAALMAAAREKRRALKSKVQGPESKVNKLTRRASEGTAASASERDDHYIQKQALLAEPLSLDDLLRDDLDEGPLTPADFEPAVGTETGTQVSVIADEGDFSASPRPDRAPRPFRKPKLRQPSGGPPRKPRKGKDRRDVSLEARPREDFGRKRGGKRVLGPLDEGRGPAGEKGGNFRFRPKKKKKDQPAHDKQTHSGHRRGQARNEQPAPRGPHKGKGKRKGRR